MIICARCNRENLDHYKFCLGCGGELVKPARPAAAAGGGVAGVEAAGAARAVAVPSQPTPPPPVAGLGTEPARAGAVPDLVAAVQSALDHRGKPSGEIERASTPLAVQPVDGSGDGVLAHSATPRPENAHDGPPPAAMPAGSTACPNCGAPVPQDFMFCGRCGERLQRRPATPAPVRDRTGEPAAARGQLILIRPDGSEGGSIPLHEGETIIGRSSGPLFESDVYLSPRHAQLTLGEDYLIVADLGSLNGVFVRMIEEEEIDSGEMFRMGQELLRFDVISPPAPRDDGTELMGSPNPGFWGRLSVVVGRDVLGSAFPLFGDAVVLGRERGDILFPEDGYVSGTHARISQRAGKFYLADLGSSNGTFIRVRGERAVKSGAFVLMGQQLFRVTYR